MLGVTVPEQGRELEIKHCAAEINSRQYWDARFASDWDTSGGREQSRQFMELVLAYLPADIRAEIRSERLSILDCGCAKGDGTAVLATAFPASAVAGCDLSGVGVAAAQQNYSGLEFFVADFLTLERRADVLVSSNCLEHLREPLLALRRLTACARRYVVLLLPFLEQPPTEPEHLQVIHSSTLPDEVANWRLTHRVVVPPSAVWAQCQILLVYQPAAHLPAGSETRLLAAAVSDGHGAMLLLEGALERIHSALGDRHPLAAPPAEAAGGAAVPRDDSRRLRAELRVSRIELAHRQGEVLALRGRLDAVREVAKRGAAELMDLQEERGDFLGRAEELRRQRDELAAQLALLRREKEALERSSGVQLLHRFWALLPRLAPPGGWRRQLLSGGLALVRRTLLPASAPPAAIAAPGSEEGGLADLDLDAAWERFAGALGDRGSGRPLIAIFSGTRLAPNEGQRPMQLARELARRGLPVVFAYWRWSKDEVCRQDQLEQGILQVPIDVVAADPERLARLGAGGSRVALFEFPHPDLVEVLASLNGAGWVTACDVLDDWQEFHRVGQALWYEEQVEQHFLNATDAVFAVNATLAERVRRSGGETVEVVPNAWRRGIEVVRAPSPLPRGEVTVGYFGYLSEAWFDWDLLRRAAVERPSWLFYLIGYGGAPAELPANLVLLGKKEPEELASLAANWDVAIVPFRPGPLAAGADPIKIYEYLALDLPVVVTGVDAPAGAEELVRRVDGGPQEFVATLAAAAASRDRDGDRRRRFAARNTWAARVDAILATLHRRRQRVGEKLRLASGR